MTCLVEHYKSIKILYPTCRSATEWLMARQSPEQFWHGGGLVVDNTACEASLDKCWLDGPEFTSSN